MKLFFRIITLLFILLVFRIVLPFVDLYPYKFTKEYYLIGTGNKNYIIKNGIFGKTLISDMKRNGDWIITRKAVYGVKGDMYNLENNYFYIDRKTDSVIDFENLRDLNKYIISKGNQRYSMSDSENLVHLKYGNGRDRKFKE